MSEQQQENDDGELESTSSELPEQQSQKAPLLEKVGVLEAPEWPVTGAFDPQDIGKSMAQRMCHWGPLLAVFLIATIGLSSMIVFSSYWPPLESISATRFGGGYVKLGWTPEDRSFHRKLQYCVICEGYKAPRSHHCARCNRCVFKMDHHCPWLNNCVGNRNHALFVKFCAASIIGCLHAAIILFKCIITTIYLLYYADKTTRVIPHDLPITDINTMIAALIGATLSAGVCVALCPLLYVQLWSISHNKTYIEDYIVAKADARRRPIDPPFVFPYDLGWHRNIYEVFGNGTFPFGNGIWWPIRGDCTQFTFSEEQIDQKHVKTRHARIRTVGIDYNGGMFMGAFRHGCRTFFCQPLTDGRRVAVSAGDRWAITRGNKYWVYAKKVEKQSFVDEDGAVQHSFVGTDHFARGWFPKVCLEVTKSE